MSSDRVNFIVKGVPSFTGFVTSKPMIAITSDGEVIEVPAGTPIPQIRCIEVRADHDVVD